MGHCRCHTYVMFTNLLYSTSPTRQTHRDPNMDSACELRVIDTEFSLAEESRATEPWPPAAAAKIDRRRKRINM